MRVSVDDQIFSMQRVGGISRYFANLLPALSLRPEIDVTLQVWLTRNEHLRWPGVLHGNGPGWWYSRRLLDAANLPLRRRSSAADLVHHTFYRSERLRVPGTAGPACVITIHDMIPELFAANGAMSDSHMAKRDYVDRCDGVVVVSETSRRDVERVYGRLDKPIQVTPLGVESRYRQDGLPVPELPQSYVLYVGKRSGYKDFATMLRGFSALAGAQRDLHLVCVGGGPLQADECDLIDSHGVARRVHQVSVTDEQLPTVYRRAAAFCFPSRYEGFGLPVLEAMASGCPIVITDADALVEVSEGAAAIFPAGDGEALAAALEDTLGNTVASQGRIEQGRRRAERATWDRTAALTHDLYEEVLRTRRTARTRRQF